MDTEEQAEKTYRKEITIGAVVLFVVAAAVGAVVLAIYNSQPKITYQPAKACDLLTAAEARDLLGSKMIKSGTKDPEIDGDTATSTCGYTDGNADMNQAVVAAINVRSGINDKGVQQNKTEFTAGKPKKATTVKGIGDSAYWNEGSGQLNVLSGHKWVIISYGKGSAPETNALSDAKKLAKKVLN